jgi:hypothetical protein
MEPLENRHLLAGVALDPSFGDEGYVITPDRGSGDLLINTSDGGIIEVNRIEIQRYDTNGNFEWSEETGGLFVGAVLDGQGGILWAGTIWGTGGAGKRGVAIVPFGVTTFRTERLMKTSVGATASQR